MEFKVTVLGENAAAGAPGIDDAIAIGHWATATDGSAVAIGINK